VGRVRWKGWLFAAPWVIGMSVFTLYPFCASVYYSFTDFSVIRQPIWIGAENYSEMAGDVRFWQVLKNTLTYAALSIPSGLLLSLSLALLMHSVRRGQWLYSVVFYLPMLVPPTASAILWLWIFNADFGLLNAALQPFYDAANSFRMWMDPTLAARIGGDANLLWHPPAWFASETWALPALVVMAMWTTGQTAFIFLAKLRDVPQELYEAAEIDGASAWQKIRHVTLPSISPIIFFNLIMAIIGAFQIFAEPFLMSGGEGGPDFATTFMPQYIWDNAFRSLRMGYACAMSWILFLVIMVLTLLAFRMARRHVYYAGRN
jgi:multiple sugar transport system permease protein